MIRMFILSTLLLFCGCASHMANIHPEWNPAGGIEEAKKRCNASSKYAWAPYWEYCRCMAGYGYERVSGPEPNESSATAAVQKKS